MNREAYTPLTNLNVPPLLDEQLAVFTPESIHAQKVGRFNPSEALAALHTKEGERVIGADFGGDKGVTQLFEVRDGRLVISNGYSDYVQGDHGANYLQSLERTAAFAQEHSIPVGISWGTVLNGTRPSYHPKSEKFLQELQDTYDGDFAALLPTMRACLNDGPAGAISGALEAERTNTVDSLLFPINGGGLGMAVLENGTLYATEAGHSEGIDALNDYRQTTPCGIFGAKFVCLETLGANKAGIEAQWQELRNQYLRAKDIEDRYKEGDELAGQLYDHSALVVAHMIAGTAQAFDIDITDSRAAIVGHGGAFKFPYYGERIVQILTQHFGAMPEIIMTKDYCDPNSNACMEGAAIAAITAAK